MCSLAAGLLLSGCAKEDPFTGPADEAVGMLMTRCLAPTVTNPEGLEATTRAGVSTDDFKVVITRKNAARNAAGSSTQPGSVEYKYSEMPEVLTLPADEYKVYASLGDNKEAAWDEPYYYGESEFIIEANRVTDDAEPIVASLSNVRVTIMFHPSLLSAMSDDSKVEVKVGDRGALTFMPKETRSAYFQFVDDSQTLTATFTGKVDGNDVTETKAYDNVAKGNHYRITFRLHGIEEDDPGTIQTGLTVDASVEKVDMNTTVDGEKDTYEEDDMRPVQGGGDEPTPPGPGPDDPAGPKPSASALEPAGDYAGFTKLDLDNVNEITDKLYCAWKVVSEAEGGFLEFGVTIVSTTLTPEELSNVGLTDKLDLITPGEYEEDLAGLGFPVNIGGWKEAEFDITGFLTLMKALGEGTHQFKLKVRDANGTSEFNIRLHND